VENLKITFQLRNGIVVGPYPIHFDAILTYAKAVDELGYLALTEEGRKHKLSPLPLEMFGVEKKVYHASIGFPNSSPEYHRMYVKTWGNFIPDHIQTREQQANLMSKGWGKAYQNHLRKIAAKEIIFFARGIRSEIERLLQYISYIGKKGAQGQGEIISFTVEPIEEDRSLIWEGKPMRVIPYSEWKGDPNVFVMIATYQAPYDNKNRDYCVAPEPSLWQPLFTKIETTETTVKYRKKPIDRSGDSIWD
jgi:CRISPR type IV-associated protein Csf3